MRPVSAFIPHVTLSRRLLPGLLTAWLLLIASTAFAAPGDLDPTFGTGGKVTTDFGGFDNASALVVQPDGKLVAAGTSNDRSALARHNPDGSLDPTFGVGGKVTTDFGGCCGRTVALVLQPDGKLVAASSTLVGFFIAFALARYMPDGTLDLSFGTGGTVTTDFGGTGGVPSALVLQQDGKLVAAGLSSCSPFSSCFALARYNPDGSLDTSLNPAGSVPGTVTTDFGGSFQTGARALVLQPDGKLVAAGVADANFGTPDFALARYNADGSLDTTFGTGGKVTTDFGGLFGNDDARALVIQPDGKLVAAGVSDGNSALARYNPDGSLDTSFNGTGKVTTGVGNGGASAALVLQPDGKLVAAGFAVVGFLTDFGLARYNPDGSLDGTFGGGGIVTTDFFGSFDEASALVLQPDGKLVAAGVANANFGTPNFALARYEGTPFPDLTGAWNSLSQICRTTRRGLQRCRLAGQVNVMNQGNVRVPRASMLRFFLSSDGVTPETFLRQVGVGALRAGQTQGKRLSVALPIGTTATGKFVLAILDATNVITETDKTNNMIVFGPLP